jgi:hypothetical protein
MSHLIERRIYLRGDSANSRGRTCTGKTLNRKGCDENEPVEMVHLL